MKRSDYEIDDRPVNYSIITFTGPRRLLNKLDHGWNKEHFTKVLYFEISDDYGEFPDTSGYTRSDWEKIETVVEDPALFRYMQRAVDAVVEYNDKKITFLDKKGHRNIEGFIQGMNEGSKLFALGGIVRSYPPGVIVSPHSTKFVRSLKNMGLLN